MPVGFLDEEQLKKIILVYSPKDYKIKKLFERNMRGIEGFQTLQAKSVFQ